MARVSAGSLTRIRSPASFTVYHCRLAPRPVCQYRRRNGYTPAAGALTAHWFSLRWLFWKGREFRSNSPTLAPKKSRGLAATETRYASSSFTSVRSVPTLTPKVVTPAGSLRKPTTSTAKLLPWEPVPGTPGKTLGAKEVTRLPSMSVMSTGVASSSKLTVSTRWAPAGEVSDPALASSGTATPAASTRVPLICRNARPPLLARAGSAGPCTTRTMKPRSVEADAGSTAEAGRLLVVVPALADCNAASTARNRRDLGRFMIGRCLLQTRSGTPERCPLQEPGMAQDFLGVDNRFRNEFARWNLSRGEAPESHRRVPSPGSMSTAPRDRGGSPQDTQGAVG